MAIFNSYVSLPEGITGGAPKCLRRNFTGPRYGDDTPFVLPLLQGFTMVLHQGQVPGPEMPKVNVSGMWGQKKRDVNLAFAHEH